MKSSEQLKTLEIKRVRNKPLICTGYVKFLGLKKAMWEGNLGCEIISIFLEGTSSKFLNKKTGSSALSSVSYFMLYLTYIAYLWLEVSIINTAVFYKII